MIDFIKTAEAYDKREVKVNVRDRIPKPKWLDMYHDQLAFFYFREDKILTEGRVLPGALVIANDKLFKKNILFFLNKSHPANFIYSEDKYYKENPEKLSSLAGCLAELYGKKARDEDEQVIVGMFQGGFNRPIRQRIPDSMTGGHTVYMTTIIVNRAHLPGGRISGTIYPILVIDDEQADAMILPKWYWAEK